MALALGIDIGMRWETTGSAMVEFENETWRACVLAPISWPSEPCTPQAMADAIIRFALEHLVGAIGLDGPQAWKDPSYRSPFSGRECERLTRTPGKTGPFGGCKPGAMIGWVGFSIELFDHILNSGHATLVNAAKPIVLPPQRRGFYVLECFPTSTWRASGLSALPGHQIDLATVNQYGEALRRAFDLPAWKGVADTAAGSEHDHLQSLVAALPAAAVLGGPCQAIANGLPGEKCEASASTPAHRIEGIIWDARPKGNHAAHFQPITPIQARAVLTASHEAKLTLIEPQQLTRGIRLYRYLASRAMQGEALGIGYANFLAHIHGAATFRDLAGRNYLPSDSGTAIQLAHEITRAAGGRRRICRGDCVIDAGMDTFIWKAAKPFDRPAAAWSNHRYAIPYSRDEWIAIFPPGHRRLMSAAELNRMSGIQSEDINAVPAQDGTTISVR